MCMIDGSEEVDFERKKYPVARKPHKCSECGRQIESGEKYIYTTYGMDGEIYGNKRCAHCDVVADWLALHCHGYIFEHMKEDLEEHYEEGYREDNLQRLVVGIRRQWKAFRDDGLLPLPTEPKIAIAS